MALVRRSAVALRTELCTTTLRILHMIRRGDIVLHLFVIILQQRPRPCSRSLVPQGGCGRED